MDAHEARVRRLAISKGLTLKKSRQRDRRAYDFGTYMLVDRQTEVVVASGRGPYGLTMNQVEEFLRNR